MSDWRKEAQTRVKEKKQGNTQRLEQGNNCMRVLPSKKDIDANGRVNPKGISHKPYREFKIHRNVGPDKAMLTCGHDSEGKGKCWLCDVQIPELEASGNSVKKARAKEIGPQDQFLVIASRFDVESQTFSAPKPWWMSMGGGLTLGVRVFSKISSSRKDYVDPNKGYNLNIERVGEGLKTKYPEVEGDESPTKVPATVLAQIKDLDSVMIPYDAEEQKSAYFGRPRRDEEENGDRRERRGRDSGEREREKETAEDDEPASSEDEETPEGEGEGEDEDTPEDAPEDAEDEETPEEEDAPAEDDAPEDEEYEPEPEEEPAPPPKKKAPAAAPPPKKALPPKKQAAPPPKRR